MRLALPLVATLALCLAPVAGRIASGTVVSVDDAAPEDTSAPPDPVGEKLESRLRRLREDRSREALRGGRGDEYVAAR
jgi:hypothetical protein